MVEIVVAQRMWQRRDTAAAWSSVNPVLHAGEIGVELGAAPESTKFKIGTGAHAWNSLPYFSGGGERGATIEIRTDSGYIQYSTDEGATWENIIALSELKGAPGGPGPIGPPGPSNSAYFGGTFDGGNVDIAPGAFCDVRVPYGCTLTKASLIADNVGDLIVDVRAVPFAAYPPLGSDSITGPNPPRVLGVNKWEDNTLAGWSTELADGVVVRFHVLTCAEVKRASVLIEGIRT